MCETPRSRFRYARRKPESVRLFGFRVSYGASTMKVRLPAMPTAATAAVPRRPTQWTAPVYRAVRAGTRGRSVGSSSADTRGMMTMPSKSWVRRKVRKASEGLVLG